MQEDKNQSQTNRVAFEHIFSTSDLDSRKTKIICTLGTACESPSTLNKLLDAGMQVARVDCSIGNAESIQAQITNLKKVLEGRIGARCPIMVDLQGSQIRTGKNKDGAVITISTGQSLKIVSDLEVESDGMTISTSYPLPVTVGQQILIADGDLVCEVQAIDGDVIDVKCLNSWDLEEYSQVHLPGVALDLEITEKDMQDIKEIAIENQVDYICISGVRKPDEVINVREKLDSFDGHHIKIISKIESAEGLENFESILQESDGINIVRKTLGLEILPEKVFVAQKWMTTQAQLQAKIVMISSQVLDSMVHSPRCQESEIQDIANAVNDGVDCLVLGRETALGSNAEKTVIQLSKICVESERTLDYAFDSKEIRNASPIQYGTAESVASAAVQICSDLKIKLIIVQTENGNAAKLVAKFKPKAKVFACAFPSLVARQLQMVKGVIPFQLGAQHEDIEDISDVMIKAANKQRLCHKGDKVIVMVGLNEENPDETTVMRVVNVE